MSELTHQRRITTAFIATQPLTVQLIPQAKVKKPAGGFVWEDQPPRAPQTLRLIEPGGMPPPVVTADGVERTVDFELLGEWDAVIGLWDHFVYDLRQWEVVQLLHFNGWERRAVVSRRG